MSSTVFNPMNFITENTNNSHSLDYMVATEETYFYKALNFVIESRQEFDNASKSLYKTILESSNNQEVITEGFSDFFAKIKEIIDKFIKFIKSLFAKFITNLNAAFKREKYLIKHKEDFKKFNSKNEFSFDGYEFTFSPAIPAINALAAFNKEFIEIDFNKLNEITGEKKLKEIADQISNQYTEFINKLENDYYDYFRGRVIGEELSPIGESEFANELFALYRNGYASKEHIDVNNSYIQDIYRRFEDNKTMEKDTKKTKERIEREYEAIKKQVEKMVHRNYDKDPTKMTAAIKGPDGDIPAFPLNNEILTKIDLFVKAKVGQVEKMSAIHALAFSAKLDAINDCFRQDKAVLYKALSKIQGTISEDTKILVSEEMYDSKEAE